MNHKTITEKDKIHKYINFPDKESKDGLDKMLDELCKEGRKRVVKEVLKLIKAWNGYGDDRFPEGEVKELVREVKKLRSI